MFNFKKKDAPKKSVNYVGALAQMQNYGIAHDNQGQYFFPELPECVAPQDHMLAMDGFCQQMAGYAGLEPQFYSGFIGYQILSQMAQSSEYRSVAETNAEEMTREWGKVKGADEKVLQQIENEMDRLGVRNLMRKQVENDHLYGGSQLFIRIKDQEDKSALPLLLTDKGVKKGSLDGFSVIEPLWTTPLEYNSTDPTAPDFYKPTKWYVMGKQVHSDRMLTLIMRPVPDMLKPAYNFRGVSMSQLMKPYVQRFQRTVDSISDVVHSFSLTGIKMDMSNIMSGTSGGINQLLARLKIFAEQRNNQGIMVLDKEGGEEFFQFNTPLSTLDALQSQAHEMLATPAKIPLVKLLGLTPAGLNANSDGEIRVYYDHVAAMQEAHLLPQIKIILQLIQLNLFGEIDPDIFFQFNPLYQLDANEQAAVNLAKAQTDQIYLQEGVLDQETVLGRLNDDDDGDYTGKAGDVEIRDDYNTEVEE